MILLVQIAPTSQLLVLNVSEGWEPLCSFLGKDVPDVPFPRENVGNIKVKYHINLNRKKRLISFYNLYV